MLFSTGVNILGTKYYKNKITVVVELLISMMNVVSSVVQNEVSAFLRLLLLLCFLCGLCFHPPLADRTTKAAGQRRESSPPAVQSSRRRESLAKNADICTVNVKLYISVSLGRIENESMSKNIDEKSSISVKSHN